MSFGQKIPIGLYLLSVIADEQICVHNYVYSMKNDTQTTEDNSFAKLIFISCGNSMK